MVKDTERDENREVVDEDRRVPVKKSGARGIKAYLDNNKRSNLLLRRADQLNYSDKELLE